MTNIDNNGIIRIGKIKFTNVWPLFYYFPLQRPEFHNKVSFEEQVPTQLNRAIAEGSIDMGPISSFEYGANFRDYLLYPDMSVSAHGTVRSLLLFHREPLDKVANGSVSLPTTSATTVNLLKIILEKFYGGKPAYTYAAPSLGDMMNQTDAALLIGDDAIRASWEKHGYLVTDLGEEWLRQTGKWMSFAVWAVRKQTVERYPELVKRVFDGFMESKSKSLADPSGMIGEAVAAIGGEESYWRTYFGGLCYDFGRVQWEGLQLYYDYAWEMGFLPERVPLQIWSESGAYRPDLSAARVNE
ncbi:menaquinone biosynthetic enzyme MqnA/MqnD family protein [Gordoniibacillus kamchatkensis]|uniref:menaquinone biosynthetic enzyme MqnA/MqnD family protein n=1 Tax=Gordoniibacillus kamchatkensis TaxID=1590651 RepID=UPI000697115B|nr:menaquinone biosynthesis protein [Paenibacillus sp. VKM B-2647]